MSERDGEVAARVGEVLRSTSLAGARPDPAGVFARAAVRVERGWTQGAPARRADGTPVECTAAVAACRWRLDGAVRVEAVAAAGGDRELCGAGRRVRLHPLAGPVEVDGGRGAPFDWVDLARGVHRKQVEVEGADGGSE